MVFSHVTLRKVSVYLLLVVQIVFFGILGDLLFDNCTGKKDETCLDGSGQFLKLQDSFYNSMLLITSAPQAIPMQGPLVSQARWYSLSLSFFLSLPTYPIIHSIQAHGLLRFISIYRKSTIVQINYRIFNADFQVHN
jgi:hypothetical protein